MKRLMVVLVGIACLAFVGGCVIEDADMPDMKIEIDGSVDSSSTSTEPPDMAVESPCAPGDVQGFCAFDCNVSIAGQRQSGKSYCTPVQKPSSLSLTMNVDRIKDPSPSPINRGCLCQLKLGPDSGNGLNLSTARIRIGFSYAFDYQYQEVGLSQTQNTDEVVIFTRKSASDKNQRVLLDYLGGLSTNGDVMIDANSRLPNGDAERYLFVLFFPNYRNTNPDCLKSSPAAYCDMPAEAKWTFSKLKIESPALNIDLGRNK